MPIPKLALGNHRKGQKLLNNQFLQGLARRGQRAKLQ